jgi:uncharacterized repeat protein (TIGR03833 family)
LRHYTKEKGVEWYDTITKNQGKKMDGRRREVVTPGAHVMIVLKEDQRSGKLTEGVVQDILTSSASHPHGIKVRLTNGLVGRVKAILPKKL